MGGIPGYVIPCYSLILPARWQLKPSRGEGLGKGRRSIYMSTRLSRQLTVEGGLLGGVSALQETA